MQRKSFSFKSVIVLGMVFLLISLAMYGLSRINKKTSVAFVIKAERFSFTVDTSSAMTSLMKLYSENLMGKRVSLSNLQPIVFQRGKFFEMPKKSLITEVSKLIIKSSIPNKGLNIQFTDHFGGIALIKLEIYSDVRLTMEKIGADIQFNFEDVKQNDSTRILYEGQFSLLEDTTEVSLKNCYLNDGDKVIKNIDSRSYNIGWLPDESSKNIIFQGRSGSSSFSLELEKPKEKVDIFANFKIRDINFSRPLYVQNALPEESTILDSSFIRIFDPDRKDIQLLKRDYFESVPNAFTIESITLAEDGFWLRFHGKLESLKIGKRGYLGDNQILNYLVWLSKNSTLIIIGAALIWLVSELLKVAPLFLQHVSKIESQKSRRRRASIFPRLRKLKNR